MWAGPSTRGLIWKRRGDPARTGLAPEPYRLMTVTAWAGMVLYIYCCSQYYYITRQTYIYIYVVRICVLDLTKTGSAWMNIWDMYAIAAYIYIGPLRHQLKMHWRTSATGTSTLAELRVRGHLGSSSRHLAPATTIKKC